MSSTLTETGFTSDAGESWTMGRCAPDVKAKRSGFTVRVHRLFRLLPLLSSTVKGVNGMSYRHIRDRVYLLFFSFYSHYRNKTGSRLHVWPKRSNNQQYQVNSPHSRGFTPSQEPTQ